MVRTADPTWLMLIRCFRGAIPIGKKNGGAEKKDMVPIGSQGNRRANLRRKKCHFAIAHTNENSPRRHALIKSRLLVSMRLVATISSAVIQQNEATSRASS